MSTPTLRWLQIHQYEQFEPVRIEFSPKENLILGLNGAGKTQLLKLIWAVLSLSLEELGERELHVEFELVTRDRKLREVTVAGRVRRAPQPDVVEPASLEGPVRRTTSDMEVSLWFRGSDTAVEFQRQGSDARLLDSEGEVLAHDHEPWSLSLSPHDYVWDWKIAEREINEVYDMYPRRGCCSFGETASEFQILTSELEFELRFTDGLSHAPLVRTHVGKLGRISPRLLWDMAPMAQKIAHRYTRESLTTGIELDDLEVDAAVLFKPVGIDRLRLVPEVVSEFEQRVLCRGLSIRVRFGSGAEVRGGDLTFGQRRYLYAALVSSVHPDKPVVCDEIDNGMHPRLVLALLEMWSDRQVFVATHNPLVIDSTNFYSPEDVREKIHIVRRDDAGRQTVGVFDEATAREIYAAIDIKIQSPSDVLEAEGLW